MKLIIFTLLLSSQVMAEEKPKDKRDYRMHNRRNRTGNNHISNPVRDIKPGIFRAGDLAKYFSRPYGAVPTERMLEVRCPYSYCLIDDFEYIASFKFNF